MVPSGPPLQHLVTIFPALLPGPSSQFFPFGKHKVLLTEKLVRPPKRAGLPRFILGPLGSSLIPVCNCLALVNACLNDHLAWLSCLQLLGHVQFPLEGSFCLAHCPSFILHINLQNCSVAVSFLAPTDSTKVQSQGPPLQSNNLIGDWLFVRSFTQFSFISARF